MDSARRCRDCGETLGDGTLEACPRCGGRSLARVLLQGGYEIQQHASVLMAAVTFCAGLVVFRTLGGIFWPYALGASSAHAGALAHLQLLIAGTTLLYLILRRAEGDFRALFLISLGLFAGCETLGALLRGYGLNTLEPLIVVFNLALFLFSSLALTAAIADGPRQNGHHRAMMVGSGGFMFLGAVQLFFEMQPQAVPESMRNSRICLILSALLVAVAALVVLQELRVRKPQIPALPPPPSAAKRQA